MDGMSLDYTAAGAPIRDDLRAAHAMVLELVAFTDAVTADDEDALRRARAALREVLSDAAFVDTCATIGVFNVVDRIADATGIPLDDLMLSMSAQVREELDLARFGSAANTPGQRRRAAS